MLAPIVIFVYNRPEHTMRTIESLSENVLAEESIVYIFSDAPKNEKSTEKVANVRTYIDSLASRNLFKMVKIIKAEQNKGLANSVISGVTQVIGKHGKVIVVEDDLVSSKDFLQYMNDALDYYEKDDQIWSVSGYNLPIEIPEDYKSEIYLSYRGCSWGYATWKNRWERVDWNVADYKNFKSSRKLRKKFNRGGLDMTNMLESQMRGKIDSWAIRWCYTQSKLDMLTVYPVVSRIQNIGLDGSGTNSSSTSCYKSLLNNECRKCNFCNPGLNKQILKNFKDYYMTLPNYYKIKTKEYVNKLLRM